MAVRRLLLLVSLSFPILAVSAVRAAEPPVDADGLAAAARAALDSWKYEAASEALAKLAGVAPEDQRLAALKIEFLARIGRCEEAAGLAKSADVALAEKLPLEVVLRVGRGLAAGGEPRAARRWVLAAARRAGPDQAGRMAGALSAALCPRGCPGLVTETFAAELSSPEGERAEAVKACKAAAGALRGEPETGPAGPYLQLARRVLLWRLEQLLGEGGSAEPPVEGLKSLSRMLWQVPVGIDEQPESAALAGGVALVACRMNGQALPGMPLADRLRAFDLKTGEQRWSLELAPKTDEAGGGEAPGAPGAPAAQGPSVSYCGRAAGLAAGGDRAYVLVKTDKFERRGASRTGSTSGARLVAVDAADGRQLWARDVPQSAERLHLVGDKLVVSGFRKLTGLAAADGRQLWDQELERALSGEGAVSAGGLVLPGWREMACIDPATGNVRWTSPRAGGTAAVTKRCVSDGTLVAVGESEPGADSIRILDGAGGKQLWVKRFSVPRGERSEMELALSGGMLVASRGPALRGALARDGGAAWRMVLPPPGGGDPGLARAGGVVVWCGGGMLAALDPRTGKPVWWCPAPLADMRLLDAGGEPAGLLLTASASSGGMLSAWRTSPDDAAVAAAVAVAAGRLTAIAGKLAAEGEVRAAECLLEAARSVALPGNFEVALAGFRPGSRPADGVAAAFAGRGLFLCALAAAAGGPDCDAAAAVARGLLDKAGADEGVACLAAAALVLLGDEAGLKHLAGHPAAWAARPERLAAVLMACREAGDRAAPALVAGLASADAAARAAIAEYLAGCKPADVRAALEKLMADPDRAARMAAAASLAAVAGEESVAALEAAFKREEDFVARERLRELLVALGHRPASEVRRPPGPPDVPTVTPLPTAPKLTREQAVEKLAAEGRVLWTKADGAAPALAWIAVEKKFVFVHDSEDGSLRGFGDFIKLVGRIDVTVAELAFGPDSVWAATDRGAFCYDRRTRAWSQIVVNLDMDLVEAPVEKVELTEAGVAFTVKGRGRFEFNAKTRKWTKIQGLQNP